MLTRAMNLLIIIGDHETLSSDNNWRMLIDTCNSKGAVMIGNRKMHPRIEAQFEAS